MTKNAWVLCAALVLSGTLACAGAPVTPVRELSIPFVRVKGGCFTMGSPAGAPGGPEEKPAHEVCLRDFEIGKYEVTQAQWAEVMGSNPSAHKDCGSCPVEMVSWNDAQQFLARLNARRDGFTYRLPTEAEWEYAARAGGKADRYAGGNDDAGAVAWYDGNAQLSQPVGTRAANALGLHDMSGNVWEWTNDWYDPGYYARSPRDNPTGPATGERRVVRGGSYGEQEFDQRVWYRNHLPPDYRSRSKGFRIVRVPAR